MTTNKGDVIERIVRTKIGISELSRILHVSRTSIYNWFERGHLNFETICKIGEAIDHDFTSEFPEEFAKAQNQISAKVVKQSIGDETSIHYWMNKYITLLEKYNELLTDIANPEPKVNRGYKNTIEASTPPDTITHIKESDHSFSYV